MSKKTAQSKEMKDILVALGRMPEVTTVAYGRFTRVKHHHKPGFLKALLGDDKSVHVRAYDAKGVADIFVHAKPSNFRNRWVSLLTGGMTLGELDKALLPPAAEKPEPTPVVVERVIQTNTHLSPTVPAPSSALIDPNAGQVFEVTPDLAAKWLERNTRNRKLRQSVVNRYAADMKAGRWLLTGDSIGFDSNGAIVNGQHRLWAVLEAGVPVPMMVAFDLDPKVVSVLDDHLKRNVTDVAHIRRPGSTITTKHAAIANMLISTSIVATSAEPAKALDRVSRQMQLDALDRHMEAIVFAVRDCFRSRNTRVLTATAVTTPFARAYYSKDKELLMRFARVLLDGVSDDAADKPALILRAWLNKMITSGARHRPETVYRKTERALDAFLRGEQIKTLYEASEELFPLPEERTNRARRG